MITATLKTGTHAKDSQTVVRRKLVFLDGLRGLAAIYVLIGHARWLLWEGYSEGYLQHPGSYSLPGKALVYFLSLFKYGNEAVLFFFVLSGFVIHLKYAFHFRHNKDGRFNYGEYLLKRARRIYPPFIFALLFTALLDALGRYLHFGIYSGATAYPLINSNVGNSTWDIKVFAGNLAFLYKTYVPVFGTNGPAWSLKYEWWFYMLYPAVLLLSKKNIFYSTLIVVMLFAASFFCPYWPEQLLCDISSMMIVWWVGVILAEIYARQGQWSLKFTLPLFFIFMALLTTSSLDPVLLHLKKAFLFAGLIMVCFSIPEKSRIIRFLEKLKITGDFSYTLYIIHFPLLVFLSGWVMKRSGGTLPAGFGYVFAGIILALALAYFVHYITEVPFLKKKKLR